MTAQEFDSYMQQEGLSYRTRRAYSVNVPNSIDVQNILMSVSGTYNMYAVTDECILVSVIDKIYEMEFDRISHRLYSAGIKKYLNFLRKLGKKNSYN